MADEEHEDDIGLSRRAAKMERRTPVPPSVRWMKVSQVVTSEVRLRASSVGRAAPGMRGFFAAGRAAMLVAAALLGVGGCASPAPPPPAAPAPPSAAARGGVVVALVVDQLAAWIAEERFPLLPADGGFARLRREGVLARDARYPHASSETAPGHAALFTGALPRVSGIFSADTVDPTTRERVSILRDVRTREVGPEGPLDAPGASLANLRAEPIADRFRAAHPDAVIVALSLKDRGALFAGGHRPNAVVWHDPERGVLVTSTAFATRLPSWALPLASRSALERAGQAPWTVLDPAWVAAHAGTPDDQRGEGDPLGLGRTFPHDFARARKPLLAVRFSPRGDDMLLGLALAALDGERGGESAGGERAGRAGRAPTLLSVSLSSHDYVLHTFGPDSWEAWDELLRLDRALGAFFHALDARFGPAGWSALLTGDHGANPLPETSGDPRARPWCAPGKIDRWKRPCGAAYRIDPDALGKVLVEAAGAALGPGDWILGVAPPYVYLTKAAQGLDPARRAQLAGAVVARAARVPGVLRVYDARARPERCPEPDPNDESIDALVCRAFADGAGDFYVVAKPGSLFDSLYVPGEGTSHGSPYLFERAVPLLVRAPGRVAAGEIVEEPISVLAFPRALSALLGVTPPAGTEGARELVR